MGNRDFEVLLDQAEKETRKIYGDMLTAKVALRNVFTKYLLQCTNALEEEVISERIVETCKDVLNERFGKGGVR